MRSDNTLKKFRAHGHAAERKTSRRILCWSCVLETGMREFVNLTEKLKTYAPSPGLEKETVERNMPLSKEATNLYDAMHSGQLRHTRDLAFFFFEFQQRKYIFYSTERRQH